METPGTDILAVHAATTSDYVAQGMSQYRATIPRISNYVGASLAQTIASFLCAFSCGDASREAPYQEAFVEKINRLVTTEQPLRFFIVGFSVKSTNPAKVLSQKPDLAELLGLFTLNYIAEQIESVYPAGAIITIFQHELQLGNVRQAAHDLGFDVFAQNQTPEFALLVNRFFNRHLTTVPLLSPNIAKAYEENLADYEAAFDPRLLPPSYPGLKHFFGEECSHLLPKTRNHRAKIAGHLAKAYVAGATALREALRTQFPDYNSYIRLSFRKPDDGNIVSKLGISLIYGFQGSPLHNVVGFDRSGIMSFGHCEDLKEQGGTPQTYVVDDLQLEYLLMPSQTTHG